jgi:hypothetical protein
MLRLMGDRTELQVILEILERGLTSTSIELLQRCRIFGARICVREAGCVLRGGASSHSP